MDFHNGNIVGDLQTGRCLKPVLIELFRLAAGDCQIDDATLAR